MDSNKKDTVLCFRLNAVTEKKIERLAEKFGDTRSAILRLAVAAFYELIFNRDLAGVVKEFSSIERNE